jgi:hypothetical protein
MRLARDCGFGDLVAGQVKITAKTGVNAELKIPAIVAGMIAGADCTDGLDVLRHGAMGRVLGCR